jgi:hypothetical protein
MSLGFKTPAIFKKTSPSKETSPEPAATSTEDKETPAEPAPVESTEPPVTEEGTTPPTEKKRAGIFSGLLTKKDKPAVAVVTNGESSEPVATEPVVPEPVTEETSAAPAESSTPKTKNTLSGSLSRRLSSQIKSFGRSKSPEKSKSAKVADEAPKIDTPIESTPEVAPGETVPVEEPLSTTEAPATTAELPSETIVAPAVSTQA